MLFICFVRSILYVHFPVSAQNLMGNMVPTVAVKIPNVLINFVIFEKSERKKGVLLFALFLRGKRKTAIILIDM